MTEGQFDSILSFFLHSVPSREVFKTREDEFFAVISRRFGLTRAEFSKKLADKLALSSWTPPFSESELVELAYRVNSYPVYLQIAKRIPIERVKAEFPSLEKHVVTKTEQTAGSFTSTANVAKYPVPVGDAILRRKPKRRR